MAHNALESIRDQDYSNWYLTVIDDGSKAPGASIVEEVLGEKLGQFKASGYSPEKDATYREYENAKLYRLEDTPEDKARQGGTRHPGFMNAAILESPGMRDEDVVIILCCDDALYPDSLKNLNEFYRDNPEVMYSYCHVAVYDPLVEKPDPSHKDREFWLNHGKDIPRACCVIDSTQGSYRRAVFTKHGLRYPPVAWRALDAEIYSRLDQLGPWKFNGIVGQYKGSHPSQLSYRVSEEDIYNPKDTEIP